MTRKGLRSSSFPFILCPQSVVSAPEIVLYLQSGVPRAIPKAGSDIWGSCANGEVVRRDASFQLN